LADRGLRLRFTKGRLQRTLATALALPKDPAGAFPFGDLILFAAFAVVLGTLYFRG
jgi:hypothetical protein